MRGASWLGRPHRRAHADGRRTTRVAPGVTAAFFALTFVVFTCVEPYLAAVNNPNENTRTYLTMAIVEQHTFHLDKIIERHGWVGDLGRASTAPTPSVWPPSFGRAPFGLRPPPAASGESFYMSVKAPAMSYAGVPVYWAFTKVAPRFGHKLPTLASSPAERAWWLRAATFTLRLFTAQLPCFAFLVWFERFLRRTTDDVVLRLTAVAAVAFGSNFLAYALMFVSHATCAAAAFTGFAVVLTARLESAGDVRKRRVTAALVAGLLIGMVPVLEYTALPVAVVLGIYGLSTFHRPWTLVAFVVGGALDVAGLTFYQARACEGWRSPCPKLAEGYAWLHTSSFGFGRPNLAFLRDASLSHSSGFFGMSPYMWLGLLAIPFGLFATFGTTHERRERRIGSAVWLTAMVALWVLVSAASNPHGGWSIGPRYLGAAPPFFAFGAATALERISQRRPRWRTASRAIAGGLAVAGAAQVGLVSLVYNTVNETTARPLLRFALPLARAGFVPYHAADAFGWRTPTFWYLVVGCMCAATLLAVVQPGKDRAWRYTLRLVGVIAVATWGVLPALRPVAADEPNDAHFAAYLASVWEPAGRDRLTTVRRDAEALAAKGDCKWYELAELERGLAMASEAQRDERRAGAPRARCR